MSTGFKLKIDPPSDTARGVVFHTGTNSIFVADTDDEMIYEYSVKGSLLASISTLEIDPAFDNPYCICALALVSEGST